LRNEDGNDNDARFATQMESVYAARSYDTDPRYSEFSPTYLQRVQSMETAHLATLRSLELDRAMDRLRALDFGCGNGHWMARMLSWGLLQENLAGVDIRANSVQLARRLLPGCQIENNRDGVLPFADGSFDICFVNLVFTSILEERRRVQAAMELQRVTRAGGWIFVLDFRFNNASNPNVRALTLAELISLFGDCRLQRSRKLILAPPLAALVAPRARWLAAALETLPFLRTHFLAALCKHSGGTEAHT
jgi:SAM-dependent methyltransferase